MDSNEVYIAKVGDRFFFYTDREDIDDWDDVLVVKMPQSMAWAFQATQTAYLQMHLYMEAQWELMQEKLAQDVDNTDAIDYTDVNSQAEEIFKRNGLT